MNTTITKTICIFLIYFGKIMLSVAQDAGSCDITFRTTNPNGQGYGLNDVKQIEILPDGKILALNGNKITRLYPDGMQDTTFHEITYIYYPNTNMAVVNCIALQNDGKILVGGFFNKFFYSSGVEIAVNDHLARLNPDGTVDTSFHTSLIVGRVLNIMLTSNGEILYSIYSGNTIVRLNSNGSLDNTFSAANYATYDGRFIYGLQSNGKIILKKFTSYNGNDNYDLIRLNSDGSLDSTFHFDTTGIGLSIQHLSPFSCIHIQSDDKILVGGTIISFNGSSKNSIMRFNADGSLDSSFFSNTSLYQGTIYVIKTQLDGKILIMSGGGGYNGSNEYNGNKNKRYFTRLNSDGSLDSSFVPPSNSLTYNYNYVTTANGGSVSTIAIQNDGKILVGGSFPDYVYGNFGFYFNGTYVPQAVPRYKIARVHNTSMSTGVRDLVNNKINIRVFPNPVTSLLTIETESNNNLLKIECINLMGQSVYINEVNSSKIDIEMNKLPNGVYFLKINLKNSIYIKKIVKN